jgi:XTP/dITP diphosphohydrolase
MHPLIIATHNSHKTVEIAEALGAEFVVTDLNASPQLPPTEENGSTFAENARLKAVAASRHHDGAVVLADDSGLEVHALGGAPGIFSARYAGSGATDAANRAKLLAELERLDIKGAARAASFRCAVVVAKGGETLGVFEGEVTGTLIEKERGSGGFGYDPLFVPRGYHETFAELPRVIKNRLSHRGRAVALARPLLIELCHVAA